MIRYLLWTKKNLGGDRFSREYIIDTDTTLSQLRVEKKAMHPEDGIMAYTRTFYLYNGVIFKISFYSWIEHSNEINDLIVETKNYINLLNGTQK